MNAEPKITINEFGGMLKEGGVYFLDGFDIRNENGVQSLDESFRSYEAFSTISDAGYDGLDNVDAILRVDQISSGGAPYYILLDGGDIYTYGSGSAENDVYQGWVAGTSSSGDFFNSSKPDLAEMTSGNLLMSSAKHLSLIVRGSAHSDSTSTKIVDYEGRNFSDMGIEVGDDVTCLKTGVQYEITAISTTNETNDTLEFAEETGETIDEDSEFLAVSLEKWELISEGAFENHVQFTPQAEPYRWPRPIRKTEEIGGTGGYLVLNGNYIALLASDELTFDSTFKQLPKGFQGVAMEVGNRGDVLVSAYDKSAKAYLLYWDGFTQGWNEMIRVDKAPLAMHPHGMGWVFMTDGIVTFTDGVNTQTIAEYPEKITPENFNGITSLNDDIYFAYDGYGSNPPKRQLPGVYILRKDKGFVFVKMKTNDSYYGEASSLYLNPDMRLTTGYNADPEVIVGGPHGLYEIRERTESYYEDNYNSVIFYIDLEQETQIKEVWVDMQSSLTSRGDYQSPPHEKKVTVNVGNGEEPLVREMYAEEVKGGGDTLEIKGGTVWEHPARVGQQIEFTEPNKGLGGKRAYITNIENAGTNDEEWTISPSTGIDETSSLNFILYGMKEAETKTVNVKDLSKPIRFTCNFIGSKMYLEIAVTEPGTGSNHDFPVSIKSISLF